jgi:adenylate cyclase class 2
MVPSEAVPPMRVHEVEVKYRIVEAADIDGVLAAHGVRLGAAVTQDDQAYAPSTWMRGQPKTGVTFARLRTQDGRHLFTVKTPVANELACREHETQVGDRDQMHHALLAMGYRPTVRIVKTRRTGRHGGMAVCVDEVAGLGMFLEVERMAGADDSGLGIQERLDAFVRSLGLVVERVFDTYDSLLHDA